MNRKTPRASVPKLNPEWIKQFKAEFTEFLRITKFPEPRRNGTRGSTFDYPESLIMLVAVLSVKCKVKTYQGIHRLVVQYWSILRSNPDLPPISESQLRERLKKTSTRLEDRQRSFFSFSLKRTRQTIASADKMMTRARGPVWHQKQKKHGIIPKGLHGLDRQATWSFSKADGWIYGHGSFYVTTHEVPLLGLFLWMPNSAHEAKRLEREIRVYAGRLRTVCMDSKADDQKLYFRLQRENGIQLITCPRKGKNKSASRKKMIREMWTRANRKVFRQRGTTVEPMQGLVKEIFDLERCWMRGDASNRWLFAAMGIAVQIAQRLAIQQKQSTWQIKDAVLGV